MSNIYFFKYIYLYIYYLIELNFIINFLLINHRENEISTIFIFIIINYYIYIIYIK